MSLLSQQEFDAIKSISNSSVRLEQLNDVIKRIKRCKKRLQLRFPSVFRDGILLQFLLSSIKSNKNIIHFACGLNNNYSSGFYALNEIFLLENIIKFNLRISNLSFAPKEFFNSISKSKMIHLYLRFDDISNENMKYLCHALTKNINLKHLTFSCSNNGLTDESINYFADFCINNKNLDTLSISIGNLTCNQIEILFNGIKKSQYIQHIDIEDCIINYDGMKIVTNILSSCPNITTLTIGNNGYNSTTSFFEEFGKLKYIKKLICNESQLIRTEKININVISLSLNEIYKFKNLNCVQLPLFIFDDTTNEDIKKFVLSLSNKNNQIEILQIFPLFEHLEKASLDRNPFYCQKIAYFFNLLFIHLSNSKYLKKLYIEMVGSEETFFTKNVANSFMNFLLNSKINELYAPFCCLIDLNDNILNSFINCKQLISIKDDTLDYHWLNDKNQIISKYIIDDNKKKQLIKAKKYHKIAHKQCQRNITNQLIKYIPVKDVANLISTFCGFDANPEHWLINEL